VRSPVDYKITHFHFFIVIHDYSFCLEFLNIVLVLNAFCHRSTPNGGQKWFVGFWVLEQRSGDFFDDKQAGSIAQHAGQATGPILDRRFQEFHQALLYTFKSFII
tara:strand:- start:430 stop:744 length:315 start_codon:yes stop_codon:yes gene_type:complete